MELRRYWQIICKRYRTLLWIVGVFVGIEIIYSLLATPIYKFTSKVLIKSVDAKGAILSVFPSEVYSLGMISSDLVMQGQLQMIQNSPLFRQAIANLKLEEKPHHLYAVKDLMNRNLLMVVFKKIGVKVKVPQSTQIIEVAAYSTQPRQAVDMANQVADGFVQLYNKTLREEGKKAYDFIELQLPRMNADLRAAEDAVNKFRLAHHTTSDNSYYREQLLSSLSSLENSRDSVVLNLVEAKKTVTQTLAKLKTIPEFQKSTSTYEISPRIDYIRKKIIDTEATLVSDLQKLTPQHVTVKQDQAQLKKYKDQLMKEIKETFSSRTTARTSYYDTLISSLGNAEINTAVYQAGQETYERQISDKQKELAELDRIDSEQNFLERKITALKTAISTILTNEQTAKLAMESSLSNAVVIEKSLLPLPENMKKYRFFPRRTLMAALALLLSLLLGLTVIFFQEYLDQSLAGPEEAESALKVPVLANLPGLDRH